mgnify:CR=1 FL=1
MRALEFQTKLDPEGNLKVPEDLAVRIPREQAVQVIVLVPDSSEDDDWRRLTEQQFLAGYGEGDSIYDAL